MNHSTVENTHVTKPVDSVSANFSSVMDNLVGPIGSEYCYYFYILSLLAIVFFGIIFIGIIYTGVTKKMGFSFFFLSLLYSMQFLLIYLQNRLLFNMCVHSV